MMIVLATVAAVVVIWRIPSPNYERMQRVMHTLFAVFGATVLLGVWLVFLSGLRFYVRIGGVVLAAGVAYFLLRDVRFDGDMRPIPRLPWEAKPDDLVEAHRRGQEKGALFAAEELSQIRPTDWPEYRGRLRDGVVTSGPTLARDWKSRPPKQLWKQPCGSGWASFAVVGKAVFTIEQRRDNEAVVCYHADNGREIWIYEYPAHFKEPLGGPGPRATPTFFNGEIFSLGAQGHLCCLDAATGQEKWATNILGDTPNLAWAMSGSPLVDDTMVIVNPGCQDDLKPGRALVAYDRKTGKELWASGNTKAGYSSPMFATIGGQRQIVLLDGKQLGGYDPAGGKLLWKYDWDKTMQDINVAQPIILDDGRVFISSGYNIGSAMVRVTKSPDNWEAKELWRHENKPLRCKFTSPVVFGDNLYGLDEGILACIAVADGKLRWKGDRFGHGQLLRYADSLLILAENGDLAIVDASPKEFRLLGRVKGITGARTWNVPALAAGRFYVRNDQEMACFDISQ
jgi:outer membrane protein assembly factor BamB